MPWERLQAVTFQLELSTGATRPCVFTCEDHTGQTSGDFVVKLRSEVRGKETGLLFEFLAAQLALRLGIPTPQPVLIELGDALADGLTDPVIADRVRASKGLNFGTKFLAPGYVTWRVNDAIPVALRQVATEILAFDAVIDNADRRRAKPNLLWKDDELYIFDHELAFAFTRVLGAVPLPFTEESLRFLRDHPLYHGLRKQTVDLRRFTGELESLQDDELDDLLRGVPPEFGTLYLERIQQWLVSARDRAQSLAVAIGSILQ